MTTTAQTVRAYRGPVLFGLGFRPFFLGAALFAGLAMPAWLVALTYGEAPPSHLAPRDWHVHAMIFGYLPAVMAGFLLTAIPNWTGRLPVAGGRLVLLFAFWLGGRIALSISAAAPWVAVTVDVGFLAVLATLAWREVIAGRTWRNLPVCILVTLLALAHAGFAVAGLIGGPTGPFERGALSVIALLIMLIGGRIVPSFTHNWLAKAGRTPRPAPFGTFDRIAMAAAIVTLLAWTALPESAATGALFALAAVLNAVRLARWAGWRTAPEPLVLVLHLGYLWLPVWFALTAWSVLAPGSIDGSTALHALTAGAIGTMTLAVMTRATLGHTGRPLTADLATVAIYALAIAGAAGRVIAPLLPVDYVAVLAVSGSLWSAAFLLFAAVYGPYLLGRKPASADV